MKTRERLTKKRINAELDELRTKLYRIVGLTDAEVNAEYQAHFPVSGDIETTLVEKRRKLIASVTYYFSNVLGLD